MWRSALGHVLPISHGEGADATLTLALLAIGLVIALAAGLALANRLEAMPRWRTLVAAASAGALVFLLFDLLKESASLGQGLVRNPLLMLALLAAFAAGALFIPLLDKPGNPRRVAWLWSLGISLHGAGEGWIIGTEATTAALSPTGAASFLIHKGIEAFTIPLVAMVTLTRRDLLAMPVALTLLTIAAAAAGLALGGGIAPLFMFAAGAGAATHALVRLARAIPPDARHAAALVAGVLAVYAAGLLHELEF